MNDERKSSQTHDFTCSPEEFIVDQRHKNYRNSFKRFRLRDEQVSFCIAPQVPTI